jgi:putative hydrolase of the HAD superfamily
MPAHDAILFDLFGTLVRFSFEEFDALTRETAAAFGCDTDAFARAMNQHYVAVETGEIDVGALLARSCQASGGPVAAAALAHAERRWHEFQATQMDAWHDAESVLCRVRELGMRVGLVSNAPPPVHEVWARSSLAPLVDATAFSYQVGMRKPDPRIYLGVCRELGVEPARSLFIGDGSSRELDGAREAGLHALQIRRPDDDPANDVRFGRQAWDGPRIAALGDLLERLAR